MPVQKIPFYTLSLRELAETLVNDGFEKFRARQIFDGVYAKKIFNPREFPSIPSKLRNICPRGSILSRPR